MCANVAVNELAEAVVHGDVERLAVTLFELGTVAMSSGEYDYQTVESVVRILQSDRARKFDASWQIWKHFEENWALLSERSRGKLRRAAEDEFGQSENWMWSFVIGVLFAECFADEAAMDAFVRFRQIGDSRARAILPDAIRGLSTRVTSDALKRKAHHELKLLSQDPDGEVRDEARRVLARWK